jgi:hypothetical protein
MTEIINHLIPIALASFFIGALFYYQSPSKSSAYNFLDATCKANRLSAHGAQYSRPVGKSRKIEDCCDLNAVVTESDRPPFEAALLQRSCFTPTYFSSSQPDACSLFFQSVRCPEEAEVCSFNCKYGPDLAGSTDRSCVINSQDNSVCITGGVATPLEYFQIKQHDGLTTAYRPLYIALMAVPAAILCILCFVTSVPSRWNQPQYTAVPGGTIDESALQTSSPDTSDPALPPGSDAAAAIIFPAGDGG